MVAHPERYVEATNRHNTAILRADKRLRTAHKAEWRALQREAMKKFRLAHMEEHNKWRRIFLEELKEEQGATDGRKDRVVNVRHVSIRRFPCPTCGQPEGKPCHTKAGNWTSPHVARIALNRTFITNPKRKPPQGSVTINPQRPRGTNHYERETGSGV